MKQTILSLLFCLMCVGAMRGESYNGVMVYAEGSETAYLLSEMPQVTYREGCALLTVGGAEVTRVALSKGQQLVVTWCNTEEAALTQVTNDSVSDAVRGEAKQLRGRRLIIVGRDGRLRDVSGRLIDTTEAAATGAAQ